jgi:co-chaperonin GroES (HSP10)
MSTTYPGIVNNLRIVLGARLLVELWPGVQQTPAGIVLPPMAQHTEQYGKTIRVGPDCTDVHVGDIVLVDITAGLEIAPRFVLYDEGNILAIVVPSEEEPS